MEWFLRSRSMQLDHCASDLSGAGPLGVSGKALLLVASWRSVVGPLVGDRPLWCIARRAVWRRRLPARGLRLVGAESGELQGRRRQALLHGTADPLTFITVHQRNRICRISTVSRHTYDIFENLKIPATEGSWVPKPRAETPSLCGSFALVLLSHKLSTHSHYTTSPWG